MNASKPESWFLLSSGPGAGIWNMALDEALLESAGQRGQPLLRFYGWTEPAATFGYFQKYAEVERLTALRPLVRRPTGGGLVPHDADWTYSFIVPSAHPWYALRAVESYRRLHAWLQTAFAACGTATVLAHAPRLDDPGQCFAGAERFDLIWQGRKIAGAAQRRNRLGLLIQGSVQPPPGIVRAEWEAALCDAARRDWGVVWVSAAGDADCAERARHLAAHKYSLPEYNKRR